MDDEKSQYPIPEMYRYGAWELKKTYQKHLAWGTVISVVFILCVFGLAELYLALKHQGTKERVRIVRIKTASELGAPPSITETKAPQLPLIPQPEPAPGPSPAVVGGIPTPVPQDSVIESEPERPPPREIPRVDPGDSVVLVEGLAVEVLHPNQEDRWQVGSRRNVIWRVIQTFGLLNEVYASIEFWKHGSADLQTIAPSLKVEEELNSFPWDIPLQTIISDSYKMRIIAWGYDTTGTEIADTATSDYFSIVGRLKVEVKNPAGGERWMVGSEQEIVWQITNVTGHDLDECKLSYVTYSTDGQTEHSIAEAQGTSYTWRVPDTPAENCRISVEVAAGDRYRDADVSAPFSIETVPEWIRLTIMESLRCCVNTLDKEPNLEVGPVGNSNEISINSVDPAGRGNKYKEISLTIEYNGVPESLVVNTEDSKRTDRFFWTYPSNDYAVLGELTRKLCDVLDCYFWEPKIEK